jgi:hypothetical protein
VNNFGKSIPSHETSCICSCGCFLISLEQDCPICGAMNPVYGNKSLAEREIQQARAELTRLRNIGEVEK